MYRTARQLPSPDVDYRSMDTGPQEEMREESTHRYCLLGNILRISLLNDRSSTPPFALMRHSYTHQGMSAGLSISL